MIRRTDNRRPLRNNPEYIDSSAENAESLKHDNKPCIYCWKVYDFFVKKAVCISLLRQNIDFIRLGCRKSKQNLAPS